MDKTKILEEEYKKLVYAVSHDLQSPLRVLDGHLHMLDAKIKDNEQLSIHTEAMSDSLLQMKAYLKGLIDYSRTIHSNINPQFFSIADILAVAKYELNDKIQKSGAEINISTSDTFFGDRDLIKKLVIQLLDNAIKFQPPGQQPVIHVEASSGDGQSILTIRDNGIGFSPEWKDRVFELFQKLNKATDYPGNGLGLAICQKVVEMHGGTIAVEAQEGAGCLVRVVIPVS